ncbi:Glyoxalase/Bleomycin resistance protein/Dihydroxybiphenyl dioxygenase, partial [Ochromonadaceae sp. CCMP2298]
LAFALDPDGYWVEIVVRSPSSLAAVPNKFTFAQTMLRVKDPVKSLVFYKEQLGMTLLRHSHFSDFSLYFLACVSPEDLARLGPTPNPAAPEASEYIKNMFGPVLELTHNHGTEDDLEFSYHNGNDEDKGQVRGFGHTGFLCDDLDAACADLEAKGVLFKKRPQEGSMRGLAFAYDPDNYWVEIIQRGGISLTEA